MRRGAAITVGRVLGLLCAIVSLTGTVIGCGINWTLPDNHFDGVNERGMVSLWETLDTIDLGGELKLPLIVHFRSDRRTTSPLVGSGWLFPLLESNVFQTDERHFTMVQPDGRNRFFYRKNPGDTVLKDTGGWAAKLDGNRFVAWAECGWKLEFAGGRITAITTPKGRRFTYHYANGQATGIYEAGNAILEVKVDSELVYLGRRLLFQKEQRPHVAKIGGQNVVAAVNAAFHHADDASGSKTSGSKTYAFGVTEGMQPSVTINGDRTIAWDAETGKILSDGDWKYTISSLSGGTENSLITSTASRAVVERVSSSGVHEAIFEDKLKGIKSILSADGIRRVTSYYTTGIMVGKIRQIQHLHGGEQKIVEKYSYDETGRPIRILREDGAVETHTYQGNGNSTLTRVSPNGTWESTSYDASKRPLEKSDSSGGVTTYTYDGNNLTRTTRDASGAVILADVTVDGRLMTRDIPGVRRETFEYVPGTNRIASISLDSGKVYRNLYDAEGRLLGKSLNEQLLWQIFRNLPGESESTKVYYNRKGAAFRAVDAAGSELPFEQFLAAHPQIQSSQKTPNARADLFPQAEVPNHQPSHQ